MPSIVRPPIRRLYPRPPARTGATLLTLMLALGVAGPAVADREHAPPMPSRDDVRAAEAQAAARAGDVGRIKAALLMANQRLEAAALEAEHAAEAANGARWRLELAGQAVEQARSDAADARREVARQRDEIGALVAASYQQGTALTALSAMMSADGPEGVLDQYAVFQGASTSLEADYQRFAASAALAESFTREALAAERRQQRVAARAEAAQQRAGAAAEAAQQAATSTAVEKDRLIRELAAAQQISVRLARTRQTALEQRARERAAERARQEAIVRARAEQKARAEAEAASKARAEAAAKAAAEDEAKAAENKQPSSPQPPAPPVPPAPPTPPTPPTPPAPTGGAAAAIAFALAQAGEPYQWGAAGPSAWDCSGLTMRAWEAAGVSLPHYSVAQYHAGTPVAPTQLRAGDLVFWSSSSSPQGIHHVGLYVGGGAVVHAPRTGRPVVVESMYSWVAPTHFVRL